MCISVKAICLFLLFLQISGFVLADFMYAKGYKDGKMDREKLFSMINRKRRPRWIKKN